MRFFTLKIDFKKNQEIDVNNDVTFAKYVISNTSDFRKTKLKTISVNNVVPACQLA